MLLVVGLVVLFIGCGSSDESKRKPPALVVTQTETLDAVATSSVIRGRDGGYSAFVFGRSVWTYGDTILGQPDAAGEQWHNSSASWTTDVDASDGIDGFVEARDEAGAPRIFLELTDAERRANDVSASAGERTVIWPGPIVADPERGRALVFTIEVRTASGGFDGVGTSLAVWKGLAEQPERLGSDTGQATLLFSGDEPHLAGGAVVHEDRLYAYDCAGFDKECVIGRAALESATQRSAWTFFDGATWVDEHHKAKPVLNGHDIMSVHFNEAMGRFISIYSEPLSTRVMYRLAPAPEGPWSQAGLAFETETPPAGEFVYSALAHAELSQGQTEYVSYHWPTATFESEIRLMRVNFDWLALPL